MSVAADKTEVFVATHDGKEPKGNINVTFGGEILKMVKSKKVLGIVLNEKLSFKEHIQEKTSAGFKALKSIDSFIRGNKGRSQYVSMRLYKALVCPVMDYGAPVLVKATSECSKEFGKFQRAAMLKASGCLSSTSTDAIEVLTNMQIIANRYVFRCVQGWVLNGRIPFSLCSLHCATYVRFNFRDCQSAG